MRIYREGTSPVAQYYAQQNKLCKERTWSRSSCGYGLCTYRSGTREIIASAQSAVCATTYLSIYYKELQLARSLFRRLRRHDVCVVDCSQRYSLDKFSS